MILKSARTFRLILSGLIMLTFCLFLALYFPDVGICNNSPIPIVCQGGSVGISLIVLDVLLLIFLTTFSFTSKIFMDIFRVLSFVFVLVYIGISYLIDFSCGNWMCFLDEKGLMQAIAVFVYCVIIFVLDIIFILAKVNNK